MRIFKSIESFHPASSLYLTLGYFDGVHLGHQKILTRLVSEAKKAGAKSAVFTFQEHPQRVLNPESDKFLLMSNEQKLCFFEKIGIDVCFLVPFTLEFSRQEAPFFIEEILLKRLRASKIFLGYNAHFGRQRKGNVALMRQLSPQLGFQFEEIPSVIVEGQPVSSSRVRELLKAGKMEEVERCLGRPFSVLGEVVKGDGRGAALGYPTANFTIASELLPPESVYPVTSKTMRVLNTGDSGEEFHAVFSAELYEGVLNYGRRPTFKGSSGKAELEVFLMNFKGDLYGETLEISFFPKIRGEKSFENAEALRAQIQNDVQLAERYFQSKSLKRNGKS